MCTALSLLPDPSGTAHLFGRTLDIERPYGAKVVVAPRRYPLRPRRAPAGVGQAASADPFLFIFLTRNLYYSEDKSG